MVWYTDHYYYHYHIDIWHGFLLHIYLPLVHRYTNARHVAFHIIVIIVTWMLDTLLSHVHTSLLLMLTTRVYMHVLLSYDSPCILPRLLFHVTIFMLYDCFLLLIWDIPVTGHERCGYAICGIPHLLFPFLVILFPLYCSRYIVPVSRYIVLRYQQSSGPVIMLPVSCTVVVLVTLYTWHIRS